MHVHAGILGLWPRQSLLTDEKPPLSDLHEPLRSLTVVAHALLLLAGCPPRAVVVVDTLDTLGVRVAVGEASVTGAQERRAVPIPAGGVTTTWGIGTGVIVNSVLVSSLRSLM